MRQMMKYIVHGPLKDGTNIFKTEGHESICEYTPWGCEGCFVLIHMAYMNLVIP